MKTTLIALIAATGLAAPALATTIYTPETVETVNPAPSDIHSDTALEILKRIAEEDDS